MQHINKSITLPEVFDRVARQESNDKKALLLAKYNSRHLRWFVNALYNGTYHELSVPKGFKFNHRPPEICNMTIINAIPRIDAALKFKDKNPKKSENNLVLVLEELSEREAKLILQLINGNRKIEGVSKTVFKKVYPGFFQ